MKREYDRKIESSGQADVLTLLTKYPNTYFTSEQIRKELGLKTREKVARFLKRLLKGKFVDKLRTTGSNALLYKLKPVREKQ